MYANLRVTNDGVVHYAHRVDITADEVIVHLDDNDGESNYSEPAGELRLPRNIADVKVEASF